MEARFVHDETGNLLRFHGDTHYDYDEFGRLTQERRGKNQSLVTHYTYDCQHRLINASMPDGSNASYTYDAFGRRIKKVVTNKLGGSSTTEFVWQGDNLVAELKDNEEYQTYLYEPGTFKPLALIKGEGKEAEVFYYHLDQIGTPIDITDTHGASVWSVQYRAYGNVVRKHVEDIANPLRFQGQYFDAETGLHYNRHRYYSPDTGRFTTVDPIGLAGGLNNYQYVPNPTGWVDPLGLSNVPGDCPGSNVATVTYRGDGRTHETIFQEGFQSKGTSTDLEHYAATNEPSVYVSTSMDPEVAIDFATMYGTKNGTLYTVRGQGGIDVNKTLGNKSPFPEEQEIAFSGGIRPENILGATPVKADGSYVGYTVLNLKVYSK